MDSCSTSGAQIAFTPPAYDAPLPLNPFKGWVAWGKSPYYERYSQPSSMIYARVFWADVEPNKNRFEWENFERDWNFDKAVGTKKIILRVVLDNPGEHPPGADKDIPEWLYEEMRGGGAFYRTTGSPDGDIGDGFSPDYTNPVLMREHKRFIAALGRRYNGDARIAFIEIGSLGHWGEWHTWPAGTGEFPPYPTAKLYIKHYAEAFPDKLFLLRRPLEYQLDHPQVGLFNDVIGDGTPWGTPAWLTMIASGYKSEWDRNAHPPLASDWWHTAPSGGELASHADGVLHWLQDDNFKVTLDQIRDSHTSWIGPSSPGKMLDSGKCQARIDELVKTMGYRFVIARIAHNSWVEAGGSLGVALEIDNQGTAPFYYNWPLEISLIKNNRVAVFYRLKQVDIRRWLPGKREVKAAVRIPGELGSGQYDIGIAIIDPAANKPAVDFAVDRSLRRADGRFVMGRVEIR
ncbi:MAG: DUF4832 domain-containing protein [Spirochaetales bacterium]|nr:DUF4832 domain-containing protein [Spirochaetales bacterium]